MTAVIPETSGRLDLDYLRAAIERAGRPPLPEAPLETEQLLGGRTGATVQRLSVGDRSFVLKFIQEGSWRLTGMSLEHGGEHQLWAHGLTRDIPGPIRCPVLDVAYDVEARRHWVLMEDVGAGIRDRGKFTHADSVRLFRALAEMHAHHHERVPTGAPLPLVSAPTRLFRAPVLQLSGRRTSEEAWLHAMIEDFKVVTVFLPLFLEVLGPRLADAYLDVVDDDGWVDQLDREPATFLHGDLRRANIAFEEGAIPLFDWELAAKGPPGCDLQWHCFLHYWGYPPDGVEPGGDCNDLLRAYTDAFEGAHGRPIDRAAFDRGARLGWLKVMAQLGFVLADPLYPDGGDAARRELAGALCRRAVERAVEMRSQLG